MGRRGLNNHYVQHPPYRSMVMIGRREAGGGGTTIETQSITHLLAECVRSRGGVADAKPTGSFKAGAEGVGRGGKKGRATEGKGAREKLCCDDYFFEPELLPPTGRGYPTEELLSIF